MVAGFVVLYCSASSRGQFPTLARPPLFSSIVAICDLLHSVSALAIAMDLLDSMSTEEKLMFSSVHTSLFSPIRRSWPESERATLSRHSIGIQDIIPSNLSMTSRLPFLFLIGPFLRRSVKASLVELL
jgi:hypothetical protein